MARFLAGFFTWALFFCSYSLAENKGLSLYFVDVEGGAATLIVTPAGESILIDCGNPGKRDAERIHQVATQKAGLKAIDHLLITHWHLDHYGGAERLRSLMPIHHFYDRGIPDTLAEDKNFSILVQAYKAAGGDKSKTLKAGDTIPLKQTAGSPKVSLLCLCANGKVAPDAVGAPQNPIAKAHKPLPEDKSDNAKSLGFLLQFGDWRFLDLGDLTWNVEHLLVSPTDKIGKIDVYQSTHHGLENSNNPVVINTVEPRVAIFNNGPKKGCHPQVTGTLRRVNGLEAIYQLHKNVNGGPGENTEPGKIANDSEKCQALPVILQVGPDGRSYSVQAGNNKAGTHQTRDYK
ncbi:MAG: MBL fold metallo-hydrolase [Gemmataceae bacterium]|nr:MBL fold metallo-hydrolase [Gemmataceae bacterium]